MERKEEEEAEDEEKKNALNVLAKQMKCVYVRTNEIETDREWNGKAAQHVDSITK